MGQHRKASYNGRHCKPPRHVNLAAGVTTMAAGAVVTTMTVPAMAATPAQGFQALDVSDVTVSAQAHPAVVTAEVLPATVTVAPGDTLSGLAARLCGTGMDWPGLFDANTSEVKDPNIIYPGQTLKVACTHAAAPDPPAAHVTAAVVADPLAGAGSVSAAYSAFPGAACIVTRESGGNPAAVNAASDAGGLYQDMPSTWASLGGTGLPQDASVAEQIALNVKLYDEAGLSPWAADGCPGT